MNKTRREALNLISTDIDAVVSEINEVNAEDPVNKRSPEFWREVENEIDDIKNRIEEARDEEQEYYDNMPQSFQNSEKGENAQAVVDALDEAMSAIEEINFDERESEEGEWNAVAQLETAREHVDEACGY